MSNPDLKHYFSYHEMIMDFASLAPAIDAGKTLSVAPPMSFYTTDGRVALGGNFVHFLVRLREETGLKVSDCRYLFSVPNIYRYSGLDIPTLDMFYECRVPDGVEVKAADDAGECFWVPAVDVHPELFGLRSIRHALNLYYNK